MTVSQPNPLDPMLFKPIAVLVLRGKRKKSFGSN